MNQQALFRRWLPAPVMRGELIACAFLLAACSSSGFDYQPPAKQAINEYRTGLFGRSVDDVWSASLKVAESNEQFTLVLAERDMGLIVIKLRNPNPASEYIDCGLIDGKKAVEAVQRVVKYPSNPLSLSSTIALGQGSIKLRVQSQILPSAEGNDGTSVRINSTYDLHVDTGAWSKAFQTAGSVFSRNWSFATGGESTQAFPMLKDTESITCRPTHALERQLLHDIEDFLTSNS